MNCKNMRHDLVSVALPHKFVLSGTDSNLLSFMKDAENVFNQCWKIILTLL